MLLHLIRFLKGYVTLRVQSSSVERFISICSYHGIYLWAIRPYHGYYEMNLSIPSFWKLKPILKKTGTNLVITKKTGLPFFLFRQKKQKMFCGGILICIFLIIFYHQFIWSIEFQGIHKHTEEELTEFLDHAEVQEGMWKKNVHCSEIVASIRNHYEDIIWVSASLKGCRLLIQIKENEDRTFKDKTTETHATDIIASKDGIIKHMIVRSGIPLVKEGDSVKQGQILVSGIIPITNDAQEVIQYDQTTSDADIIAEVELPYHDQMPLYSKKKKYSGTRKEFWYFCFGKYIIWFGIPNNNIKHSECIGTEHRLGKLFCGRFISEFYLSEDVPYSDLEIQKYLSENYRDRTSLLEKKGVEIIQNNVKIYKEESCISAKGTLTINMEIGSSKISEIPEEDLNGND